MPRKKKEVVFPGYIRDGKPDMVRLGELTARAVGKNRTLRDFAESCAVSPSTISRVIKGQFTNPVSDSLIAAIAENAAPESGVTLEDLLAAHGLVEVSLADDGKKKQIFISWGATGTGKSTYLIKHPQDLLKAENLSLFAMLSKDIIQTTLLDKGYSLELNKEYDIVSLPQFRYLTPFTFTTNSVKIDGLQKWAFDVHESDRFSLYQKLSWIFGTAYLDHPSDHGIKVSLLTQSVDEYEEAKVKFADITIKDCISIILVDTEIKRIVEEFQIKREDAQPHLSVLV